MKVETEINICHSEKMNADIFYNLQTQSDQDRKQQLVLQGCLAVAMTSYKHYTKQHKQMIRKQGGTFELKKTIIKPNMQDSSMISFVLQWSSMEEDMCRASCEGLTPLWTWWWMTLWR